MGTLVAMHYTIAGGVADHTYVMCSTGNAAWGCFGGETGGHPLRQANGSTMRANSIAGPNETGNLNCYLINGVCHQAANRIHFPSGITVTGASGYSVSRSMYGIYGRPNGLFRACNSPFNQHHNVHGDLPECVPVGIGQTGTTYSQAAGSVRPEFGQMGQNDIQGEIELYERANWEWSEELGIELFAHMVTSHLGLGISGYLETQLRKIRTGTERKRMELDEAHYNEELGFIEYANAFDELTLSFQHQTADVLSAEQYENLFGLGPENPVTLADPDIISPPSSDMSIDQEEDISGGPSLG